MDWTTDAACASRAQLPPPLDPPKQDALRRHQTFTHLRSSRSSELASTGSTPSSLCQLTARGAPIFAAAVQDTFGRRW